MALISCPECGKEISDKAVSCPNCGCPVNISNNEPIIVDKKNLETKVCPKCALFHSIGNEPSNLCGYCNTELIGLGKMFGEWEKMPFATQYSFCRNAEQIARETEFYDNTIEKKRKSFKEMERVMKEGKALQKSNSQSKTTVANEVKCPKCGSTQIQMVKKNWSLLTGFMTNKVDRVCMNCKNKF